MHAHSASRCGTELNTQTAFPLAEPPDLVIFDCDGVLVDSETLSDVIFHQHLVDAGVSISHTEASDRYIGWRMSDIFFDIRQRFNVDLDDNWLRKYRKASYAVFEHELQPIPHVEKAIRKLIAAEMPICVGSSGSIEKMQTTLGITGLLELFEDQLFSGWDVPYGKPAPDIFLHAASSMGHVPENCVVIETPSLVFGPDWRQKCMYWAMLTHWIHAVSATKASKYLQTCATCLG